MIKKIHIENFKRFEKQTFELDDTVVLAGPNNAGKTTLLQAIATWSLTFNKWKSQEGGRKRKNRMNLTRSEFMSLPLQHFNLLWTDTSTALRKNEGGGRGAASPRIIKITLEGTDDANQDWQHTMELRYANPDMIYIKEILSGDERPQEVDNIKIVHIPSFSGIQVQEEERKREVQDWLIGQGKSGDIIRNLLVDVSKDKVAWDQMKEDVKTLFGYTLREPDYIGRPHILCEYIEHAPRLSSIKKSPKLDIASAGNGFLQTLLIMAFIYARKATILLVDEPDAHSHISLQTQIYKYLKDKATEKGCQLVVATHSDVVIRSTQPDRITSFYGKPHRLHHDGQRKTVQRALELLSSMDVLQAGKGKVLYTEGDTDLDILLAWAKTLGHRFYKSLSMREVLHCPLQGKEVERAKAHFDALLTINPDMVGALLLDGDNQQNRGRQTTYRRKLKISIWERYEIECYLVHGDAIERFIWNKALLSFEEEKARRAEETMKSVITSEILDKPLKEHKLLNVSGVSKDELPKILSEYIDKLDYYRIAQVMLPEEIHPEVTKKLDYIADALGIPKK